MRAALLVLGAVLCAACGSSQRTCAANEFRYIDTQCIPEDPPPPDGGPPPTPGPHACYTLGDGQCYRRCATDLDCPQTAPYCRILGLYERSNQGCHGRVQVCRAADHNDC